MQVFPFQYFSRTKEKYLHKTADTEIIIFFSIYLLLKTLYENLKNADGITASLEGSQRLFFMTIVNVNSKIKRYAKLKSK